MSEIPSPVMFDRARAQQKPHRKSRLGCKVCKARKIKCDEQRPVCGNCYRRFPNPEEECEYDHGSPRAAGSPSSARGSTQGTPTPSIGSGPSSSMPTSRSMELRLFHHYSTVTCLTMPTCEETAGLNMWKSTIPSLAFECSYIYSAILGISALHLLTLLPDDIALKAATFQYIDETVSAHREEMSSTENTNPLNRFTTSLLLTVHAKLRTKFEFNSDVPYTVPVNYFMLQNGAAALYNQTSEWRSDVKEYINCYTHLAPPREPWRGPESHRYNDADSEFPYDPLPGFIELDISMTEDQRRTYIRAITYLSLIKQCIVTGEQVAWIRHRLAIAPSVFGPNFRALMQVGDPVSLLILARMYALLKIVDDPWWLQGTAEYEVSGLDAMISDEWKWGMEWPLEILEKASLFADGRN